MNKTRLYTRILIAISSIVLLISLASSIYLYYAAREELWNSKITSGERETREIAALLEQQLKSGLTKEKVIENLQRSIENTDFKSDFICMYNQKGIELCHPNPALIGIVIQDDNSEIKVTSNKTNAPFNSVLKGGKKSSGLRTFPNNKNRSSEIVNVYPVAQTDWMVASHANLKVLQEQLYSLYLQFFVTLLISTLLITFSCYVIIRLIYKKYDTDIELEIKNLNSQVSELQILNEHLNKSQERIQHTTDYTNTEDNNLSIESSKKRIITYHKDELIKLDIKEIAYIFLENGITYICTFKERQYTSSNSLDEIMKWLDNSTFYRANRQFIINIEVIQAILLYGKNQLQLKLKTAVATEIIISKNKVAEFKQWLDQ